MENSLPQSMVELKAFLEELDRFILDKALEWARKMYKAILEQVDEVIAKHRHRGLSIEHRRGAWYQTYLGPVRVNRREYRDKRKGYRYLLDEVVGVGKGRHVTRGVRQLVLELATAMPYRRSAEVLSKATAIDMAHQTLWRMVGQTADPYLEKAEQELQWFLETGEIPDGEGKKVARLLVEADGVMLSLQREKARKAEVKLGIAYEGWERIGKDRYRTVNKTAFAEVADGDSFWAGLSLKLQRKYDLSRVGDTIVGGDGAGWVKEGARYVNGRFQLDRYHLNRGLSEALGQDVATRGRVLRACDAGDEELVLKILAEARGKAGGKQAHKIAKAYYYLKENRVGLTDYRLRLGEEGKALRRTGAIEGNVDKLVVRRMKNQGMSWSIKGIRRLLCVRLMVLEGQLRGWLARPGPSQTSTHVPLRKIRRIVKELSFQESDAWLQGRLPALSGPHPSRPWVTALKNLAQVSSL